MRKIRRLLAGILCFVMVFQQAGIAKAETVHNADGIIVTDYTSESILDPLDELAVSYNDIGFKEATSIFNRNTILSFCEDDVQYAFRTPFHHYRSSILSSMLKECAWIVSIDDDGSITYVQYHMISGEEVYLSYTEDGIFDKTVYYPTLDTLVITKDNQLIRYDNFRAGIEINMSDELSQEIDLLRSLNNYRGISEINGLSVDEDGNVDFDLNEIRLSDRAMSSVKGFYTNTQLLNSLKSTFPQWTDRVDLQNTKYSAVLGKTLYGMVKSSRNSYTKKTASLQAFTVNSAVSTVAAYIGVGVALTANILTGLGILISATYLLLEEVKMAKSAIYSFTGKKVGLVKDTTIYNGQYVKVAIYSGKGEFTGGYNSSGNFDWLLTSGSSALARSDTSVVNTAYSLYEADVNVNGFVTLYAP